jgi:hypothetical protein
MCYREAPGEHIGELTLSHEKVKELHYMGDITEKSLYWFPADALKGEEGRRKVTKASVQEENTSQEET